MEQIREELLCPITQDLLQDPVNLPCCGKVISRQAGINYFATLEYPKCPCCRAEIPDFDIINTPRNVTLAYLVEQFRNPIEALIQDNPSIPQNNWSASLTPVTSTINDKQKVYELCVSLENSTFEVKPSLFIAVVDRSGSMGGSPWKQVETALIHIMAMTHNNPSVKTVIIGYDSTAEIINTSGTLQEAEHVIRHMFTGGGTMFNSAFEKIKVVLDSPAAKDVSNISIAFMTDGQAGDRPGLSNKFKDILEPYHDLQLSVHTVGFSRQCDTVLLEEMRQCGPVHGTFRYAEPTDDGDTLCNKLQSLFEIASQSSCIPIKLNEEEIYFAINSEGRGCYKRWVFNPISEININGNIVEVVNQNNNKNVNNKWIDYQLDDIANILLKLGSNNSSTDLNKLELCFVKKKLEMFSLNTTSEVSKSRIDYLNEQADQLLVGETVNLSALSDMRFASKFNQTITNKNTNKNVLKSDDQEVLGIANTANWSETRLPIYSHNNKYKGRNPLQEAICNSQCNKLTSEIQKLINLDNILYRDVDSNNTIMLCAYCGSSEVLQYILDNFQVEQHLNDVNKDGESAMTIAIKKRGFWKIIKMLNVKDVGVPENRRDGLQQYAYDNGYTITGEFLANIGADFRTVNQKMTPEYIRFAYISAGQKGLEINKSDYMNVALSKLMFDIIQELDTNITFKQFTDYTIPPKPDHVDTPKYLEISQYFLHRHPEYISQVDEEGNTCLGIAIIRGSLPHVKFFVEHGANLEIKNVKGDSPLRLACIARFPCIMQYLLELGCDINTTNDDGNNVLFPICKGGNKKMFDMLLSYGADIDHISIGGDAPLLRSCRYGKAEILEAILERTNLIDYKAPIDGFNAIFASVEADRSECIEILHRYGVDINQKTDDDNLILKGASPLHLAAYYNRKDACKTLLRLGADINIKDFNGQTALHIAVIQGHIDMIKLLRNTNIVEDNYGCTPHSYCRNHKDIRKLLVDPLLDILMQLARGQFSKDDTIKACAILKENNYINMDIFDYDKTTPLFQAVLHSNYPVVEFLLSIGCDKNVRNQHNRTCMDFASYIKNNRINKLLGVENNSNSLPPWLFLGNRPTNILNLIDSGIGQRMSFGLSRMKLVEVVPENETKYNSEDDIKEVKNSLDMIVSHVKEKNIGENFIWYAKLFTVSLLMNNGNDLITRMNIFKLCLLTNNSVLFSEPKIYKHININTPICTSEVYTGIDKIDRNIFQIGNEVYIDGLLSASTMWRIGIEHLPSFTTGGKSGTAFIIKSKTGRHVRDYSQFSSDNEVIFKDAKFKVTNWYQGNIICFAQENVRESTFKLTDKQIKEMTCTDTRLIIELDEIM